MHSALSGEPALTAWHSTAQHDLISIVELAWVPGGFGPLAALPVDRLCLPMIAGRPGSLALLGPVLPISLHTHAWHLAAHSCGAQAGLAESRAVDTNGAEAAKMRYLPT